MSSVYTDPSIPLLQVVEGENEEDDNEYDDSLDGSEDDRDDGEGDYVGRADKPYNPTVEC